ncbi:MAG: class II fructose-bisphosphate aldolase [Parcubacteria group bacterium]|nr:class II fructose-bisphosphate aldolase [Parcubacteria group bacterium]
MENLRSIIENAERRKVAVGHFNISDLVALRAIFEAARSLNVPVIIGVSEGEREFIGVRQAVALICSLRDEYKYPIFSDADHTYALEKVKEAAGAEFDAVIFDGAKLPLEENIKKTKAVVEYLKSRNKNILAEGELGYIGTSSKILESVPEGAAIKDEDLPTADRAERFVKETGVDLLAPAVGNIHGMFKNAPNPDLNIKRISEIREAAGVPLVLHGGSGIKDGDFKAAIKAGISVIHINTEIRVAWRQGLEAALKERPDEIAPYKILPEALERVKRVVTERLKLFNGIE